MLCCYIRMTVHDGMKHRSLDAMHIDWSNHLCHASMKHQSLDAMHIDWLDHLWHEAPVIECQYKVRIYADFLYLISVVVSCAT